VRAASGSPAALAHGVADAIARVDPGIAVTFTLLKEQVDAALVQERIVALLSGSFGALALLLSAVGSYGVTAYAVGRRRTEIGIRMAIGAGPARVIGLVLTRMLILLTVGVASGAAASVWAATLIATLLYGVTPRDTPTLMTAALTLVLVAGATAVVPAWRAARIDPAAVLRES
jgi:ABC-type antimicrobial peptide transport system permease subunit